MAVRSVQISLDAELLERVDADEETKRDGRSAVIRRALAASLRQKREGELQSSERASQRD